MATQPAAAGSGRGPLTGLRARRRQETIEEILDLATDVMAEAGVNGLTLAEVARRLGVQPPSLYKYFPSLMALYDALFGRGHHRHLEVMRAAMAGAEPGMAALSAGLEASGRWLVASPALGQLLFWHPVPSFEPSPEAFAPSLEMVALQRSALADAVAAGQLGPAADSDDAVFLLLTLIVGVLSQHMANEPHTAWGEGRFTPLLPRLLELFTCAYPVPAGLPPTTGRRTPAGSRHPASQQLPSSAR